MKMQGLHGQRANVTQGATGQGDCIVHYASGAAQRPLDGGDTGRGIAAVGNPIQARQFRASHIVFQRILCVAGRGFALGLGVTDVERDHVGCCRGPTMPNDRALSHSGSSDWLHSRPPHTWSHSRLFRVAMVC